jgi:hypothetical protein
MNRRFGQVLLDDLLKDRDGNHKEAAEREDKMQNCEFDIDDCFVSVWANGWSKRLLDTKIAILNDGGYADFPAIVDKDGKLVSDTHVETRYGGRYIVKDLDGNVTEWINPTEKVLAKKGYQYGSIRKPAWAKLDGSGYGLSGSVWVKTFPSDFNYWTGEDVK